MMRHLFTGLILGFTLLLSLAAFAAEEVVGRVSETKGEAKITRSGKTDAEEINLKTKVLQNDRIVTGADGRVKVLFEDDSIMTIAPNTEIKIDQFVFKPKSKERRSIFSIFKGKALALVGKAFRSSDNSFEVRTPTAVAGVRGTYFSVTVEPETAEAVKSEGEGSGSDAGEDEGLQEVALLSVIRVHEGSVNVRVVSETHPASVDVEAGNEIVVTSRGVGEVTQMDPEMIKKDLSIAVGSGTRRGGEFRNRLTSPGGQLLRNSVNERNRALAGSAPQMSTRSHGGPDDHGRGFLGDGNDGGGGFGNQFGGGLTPDDSVGRGQKTVEVKIEIPLPPANSNN